MSIELDLIALDGTNPLGFLAALGVLAAVHRAGREPTLRWDDGVVPTARVTGLTDTDDLIAVLDADRQNWRDNVVLAGPSGEFPADIKPTPTELRRWSKAVLEADDFATDALFSGLLSEGGVDGKGNSKPTHLHFTAGRQTFLAMVRELVEKVDAERLHEAVFGPWRDDSDLGSLSWSSQGDRVYALRGVNPATEKRRGVPGADWLAFLGLSFFPTCVITRQDGDLALKTTACDRQWKRSALRWPLWSVRLGRDVVWSLVGDAEIIGEGRNRNSPEASGVLTARGVSLVLEAPIRRSEQGGYGSFGGAGLIVGGDPGYGNGLSQASRADWRD